MTEHKNRPYIQVWTSFLTHTSAHNWHREMNRERTTGKEVSNIPKKPFQWIPTENTGLALISWMPCVLSSRIIFVSIIWINSEFPVNNQQDEWHRNREQCTTEGRRTVKELLPSTESECSSDEDLKEANSSISSLSLRLTSYHSKSNTCYHYIALNRLNSTSMEGKGIGWYHYIYH